MVATYQPLSVNNPLATERACFLNYPFLNSGARGTYLAAGTCFDIPLAAGIPPKYYT